VVSTTPRDHETDAFTYTPYEPGMLDHVSYGGLDGQAYFTISTVTKTPRSTAHVIPQQGFYRRKTDWLAGSRG
jgi:hypothetical protein